MGSASLANVEDKLLEAKLLRFEDDCAENLRHETAAAKRWMNDTFAQLCAVTAVRHAAGCHDAEERWLASYGAYQGMSVSGGNMPPQSGDELVCLFRVFVRDGNVWTSAGVASGIDLALRLVAHSFGDEAAIRVARENVVPFRRFSNDPDLDPQFQSRSHGNQLIHAVQDAISRDLGVSVSDPRFAHRFAMSVRHLSRVFGEETGSTPKQYQLALRMSRARQLLAASTLSVDEIALRCGFASVQAFRNYWNKVEALTPSSFRRTNMRSRNEPGGM